MGHFGSGVFDMNGTLEILQNGHRVLQRGMSEFHRPGHLRDAAGFSAFVVAYYFAYRYGMSFSQVAASPFWFPDSILLCALLMSPAATVVDLHRRDPADPPVFRSRRRHSPLVPAGDIRDRFRQRGDRGAWLCAGSSIIRSASRRCGNSGCSFSLRCSWFLLPAPLPAPRCGPFSITTIGYHGSNGSSGMCLPS